MPSGKRRSNGKSAIVDAPEPTHDAVPAPAPAPEPAGNPESTPKLTHVEQMAALRRKLRRKNPQDAPDPSRAETRAPEYKAKNPSVAQNPAHSAKVMMLPPAVTQRKYSQPTLVLDVHNTIKFKLPGAPSPSPAPGVSGAGSTTAGAAQPPPSPMVRIIDSGVPLPPDNSKKTSNGMAFFSFRGVADANDKASTGTGGGVEMATAQFGFMGCTYLPEPRAKDVSGLPDDSVVAAGTCMSVSDAVSTYTLTKPSPGKNGKLRNYVNLDPQKMSKLKFEKLEDYPPTSTLYATVEEGYLCMPLPLYATRSNLYAIFRTQKFMDLVKSVQMQTKSSSPACFGPCTKSIVSLSMKNGVNEMDVVASSHTAAGSAYSHCHDTAFVLINPPKCRMMPRTISGVPVRTTDGEPVAEVLDPNSTRLGACVSRVEQSGANNSPYILTLRMQANGAPLEDGTVQVRVWPHLAEAFFGSPPEYQEGLGADGQYVRQHKALDQALMERIQNYKSPYILVVNGTFSALPTQICAAHTDMKPPPKRGKDPSPAELRYAAHWTVDSIACMKPVPTGECPLGYVVVPSVGGATAIAKRLEDRDLVNKYGAAYGRVRNRGSFARPNAKTMTESDAVWLPEEATVEAFAVYLSTYDDNPDDSGSKNDSTTIVSYHESVHKTVRGMLAIDDGVSKFANRITKSFRKTLEHYPKQKITVSYLEKSFRASCNAGDDSDNEVASHTANASDVVTVDDKYITTYGMAVIVFLCFLNYLASTPDGINDLKRINPLLGDLPYKKTIVADSRKPEAAPANAGGEVEEEDEGEADVVDEADVDDEFNEAPVPDA